MSRMSEHHRGKCGVEGKCSVPMWMGGCPAGFCDEPAYGEQYEPGTRHAPMHCSLRDRYGHWLDPYRLPPHAPGLCCKGHGGPGPEGVRFIRDGNAWCAFLPGFENLQESIAGFGDTQPTAERDLQAKVRSAQ